jgi:cytochrome b561
MRRRHRHNAHRYTTAARWLHWIIAASVAVIIGLGLWMTYFEPADEAFKLRLYGLHESLGLTVLLLVLWRIGVRLGHAPPALPWDTPLGLRLAAALNRFAIYVLLLAQPVLGYLAASARGNPPDWWGLLPIPAPVAKDEALARLSSTLHSYGAVLLAALVGLHLIRVLYHAFIRRDGLMRRML